MNKRPTVLSFPALDRLSLIQLSSTSSLPLYSRRANAPAVRQITLPDAFRRACASSICSRVSDRLIISSAPSESQEAKSGFGMLHQSVSPSRLLKYCFASA